MRDWPRRAGTGTNAPGLLSGRKPVSRLTTTSWNVRFMKRSSGCRNDFGRRSSFATSRAAATNKRPAIWAGQSARSRADRPEARQATGPAAPPRRRAHAAVLSAALRPDVASALVSPALVESTIKAAIQFVSLRTIVPGTVSLLAQGVLSSMYLTQWLKVVSVLLVLGVTASGTGLLAQRGLQTAVPGPGGQAQAAGVDQVPTTVVKPGNLRVIVSERGSLEARYTFDAYCLIEGSTTIVMILPEGSAVKKGQVVCRLDSSALRDQLTNQNITVKSAEAKYQNAKLTREVAEIAVVEYSEGIYKQNQADLKNAVTAAESAIQKAEARKKRTEVARRRLQELHATKGPASTPADLVAELELEDRIEATETALASERAALDQARNKLVVLEKFTLPKTVKELRQEVDAARSAELAAQATFELQVSKARKLEKQLEACTIKAPRDGMLVHANDPNRLPGRPPNIDEGVTVRERQKIFSVVDLAGPMRVNTKVHESQIDKLSQKMKARIKVDAIVDQTYDGTVVEVSPRPDATNMFSPNVKVYSTLVNIDRPVEGLRPGMTAQVEIVVSERDDVLSVPVEAIVQFDDKYHVAVKKPDGAIEFREVELGMSNQKFVEVKQGIKSGDLVMVKPLDLLNDKRKREVGGKPAPSIARPENPR